MAGETLKQGLGGAQYDPSKVFDPSKERVSTIATPPKTGLDVQPNSGISTTAGASHYAGRNIPSSNPRAIAGAEAVNPQAAVNTNRTTPPIAGAAPDSAGQTSGPLGMSGRSNIAGVKSFSFDSNKPAGGLVANNSSSDWSPGSRNAQAIAGTSGLNVGPTSFSHTSIDKNGQQQTSQLGTLSNRGIAGLNYDEQVARAKEINANTMQQLGNINAKQKFDMGFVGKADPSNPSYRNAMLTREQWEKNNTNGQQALSRDKDLTIAGMALANDRYKTDQALAGEKYKADKKLAGANIKSDADMAKSVVAEREKVQQQYTDRVKGLMSGWEKLNVPADIAPKLNYYAQLHAQAEDPKGNVFMIPPNREGGQYAALPKSYEAHYQGLLKKMAPNDAVARIYGVAKKNGHAIDVPDFNRFQTKQDAAKTFGG